MTTLSLLTKKEQAQYENPPVLDTEEHAACFTLTTTLKRKIKGLRTTTNKVAFLLQYVYFKKCHRFYSIHRFSTQDIQTAVKQVRLSINDVNFSNYKDATINTHRTSICALVGYQPFNEMHAAWLSKETQYRVERFTNPRTLFIELLQLLEAQKIELPSYNRLANLISQHYSVYEKQLIRHRSVNSVRSDYPIK